MSGKSAANFCAGKDTFERMNFLYQAGTLMSATSPKLSAYYGKLCRAVAKKAVLRMEPCVKRTICKRCGYILVAGTSATIRLADHNPKLCELQCKQCGCVRRFQMNAKYASWLDDQRSVKEQLKLDYRLVPERKPPTNGGGVGGGGLTKKQRQQQWQQKQPANGVGHVERKIESDRTEQKAPQDGDIVAES